MEKLILLFCSQHFQQARHTPFGSGKLFSLLGTLGLTSTESQMLAGVWLNDNPENDTPEASESLHSVHGNSSTLAQCPSSHNGDKCRRLQRSFEEVAQTNDPATMVAFQDIPSAGWPEGWVVNTSAQCCVEGNESDGLREAWQGVHGRSQSLVCFNSMFGQCLGTFFTLVWFRFL